MAALPEYEWTLKTQSARHFSWRVRASEWIWGLEDDSDFERTYDLIIATSLSGVAGLKAMKPKLSTTPVWVYFHENQFAHPLEERQSEVHQISWQFSSLQNALCADWVSFNTEFNRNSFFAGLRQMLKRMPERLPGDPVMRLEAISDVMPVPLSDNLIKMRDVEKDPELIVWNHRWEWDKQPQVFLDALIAVKQAGVPFRLAMLGSGGAEDGRFAEERAALGDSVVCWGEAADDDYPKWISRAGIGVSAALHDFQGLAVLELALAGATIVAPRRVAYPECVPDALFYEGSTVDVELEKRDLAAAIGTSLKDAAPRTVGAPALPVWSKWKNRYKIRIEKLMHRAASSA